MQRILLILLLSLISEWVCAQDSAFLYQYNRHRNQAAGTAMLILGSWALVNIGTGTAGAFSTKGESRYFHQMNAVWNIVNLGIALPGYLGSRRALAKTLDLQQSVGQQYKAEKIYLINGALDLVYIAGGLTLRAYGNSRMPGKTQDRWKGYGTSVIVQGAFLLLFDGINYTIHLKQGYKLKQRFEKIDLGMAPGGVSLICRF